MDRQEGESRPIRRRRKHRRTYGQRLSASWLDVVALLLIAVAFLTLYLFFRAEWLTEWQLEINLIGLVAGGLGVTLGLVRLRHHVRNRRPWWAGTGCPRCGEPELKRTPRRWYDRALGHADIPVRRYVCPECHWRGARIDEQRLYR